MTITIVNGKKRYAVELSPGLKVESGSLDNLLRFLMRYGGIND